MDANNGDRNAPNFSQLSGENANFSFSKLSRTERIAFIEKQAGIDILHELDSFIHNDAELQTILAELSENYLSNFYLPLGVVPNVLINEKSYMVPVVSEESSVVAAASKASKFWFSQGGFHVHLKGTTKKGQVHFLWQGGKQFLKTHFVSIKQRLLDSTLDIAEKMSRRGGGIKDLTLIDKTAEIPNYYQLDVSFETVDAMGANFINSCLERIAETFKHEMDAFGNDGSIEVIMSILSNYTPDSLVTCTLKCPVESLSAVSGIYSPNEFARRFVFAVEMANADISRAVTHNKGIYNGVDAVLLATGNDWRAVEAAGHSFAASSGKYKSLSEAKIIEDQFVYSLTIPMAVGTVGGLTSLHPMSKVVMKILGNPAATELMGIVAALGAASNFAAITSLVTTGIQKGHMKMHLSNILKQLNATDLQIEEAKAHFSTKPISFSAVEKFLRGHSSYQK